MNINKEDIQGKDAIPVLLNKAYIVVLDIMAKDIDSEFNASHMAAKIIEEYMATGKMPRM